MADVQLYIQKVFLRQEGEYLMKISIGTPPVEIVAIADTDSDLTWTQCMPCTNCFQQLAPLFDSQKSSTYKTVGCNAEECASLGTSSCKFTFPCTYGNNVSIPNVVFGCDHDNSGTFNNYTSGIIGLGGGESHKLSQGNIRIDSGTTLTLLPSEFYSSLELTLVDSINATKKDDPSGTFGLCYESENGTIDAPKIVAHFTDADLELSTSSTFTEVEEGLVCLTIVPAEEVAIFGNLAQANFLIGYDLVANKISFLPTDCTSYLKSLCNEFGLTT
nr:aspartic proteinase CDR1-like [Nicotiana tomentosiformis]